MADPVTASAATEAVILVKAAAQQTGKKEPMIYAIGITPQGEWVRLYPITPKKGSPAFKRWDRITFTRAKLVDDARPESWRIDPNSIVVLGEMSQLRRRELLAELETTSLKKPAEQGKSLVLLRPRKAMFFVQRKTPEEIASEQAIQNALARVAAAGPAKSERPFPYKFLYRYWTDEGEHEGTYQDWEMRTTFLNLVKSYGEAQALARVIRLWGQEYLTRGVLFTMSRETPSSSIWTIQAIFSADEVDDLAARSYNLLA